MTNAVTVATRYSTRKSRSRIWVSFRLGDTTNASREARRECAIPFWGATAISDRTTMESNAAAHFLAPPEAATLSRRRARALERNRVRGRDLLARPRRHPRLGRRRIRPP